MGGNLFQLGRIPREAYLSIEQALRSYLDTALGAHYRIPRYYHQKPDFGDVDILISSAALGGQSWQDFRAKIATDLGIVRTKSTGAVFSTVYRDFQVDFFLVPEIDFISTYNFLCWNDVGNILGRTFRAANLKYGMDGLRYVHRWADGHGLEEIPVSRDMERILGFLGLDYAAWCAGFETMDDIFRWAIASPFFSTRPYLDDDNRSIRRRLQQERPTMVRFVAFLEAQGIVREPQLLEKSAYFDSVCAHFRPDGDLRAAIQAAEQREARVAAIRQKFNGELLMRWFPALSGKSLGAFIAAFRQQWPSPEAADTALEALSAEEIEAQARGFFEHFAL